MTVTPESRLSASLLLAAALLPNWASGQAVTPLPFKPDVIAEDLVPLLIAHDHDRLKEETLPIVHNCTQVVVTIRAQDMTESDLTTACIVLQETADSFHANMQTDPASPLIHLDLEVLAFNSQEKMREYLMEVYGGNWENVWGIYAEPPPESATSTIVLAFSRCCGPLAHEYVHYLDHSFNGPAAIAAGHPEGLASYLPNSDVLASPWTIARTVGDGSNLPLSLLDAWNDQDVYSWGYISVGFLFEEHPRAILLIYDLIRRTRVSDRQVVLDYISEVLPPLTAEFHEWLTNFVPPTTVRHIEPITLFGADGVEVPYQRKQAAGGLMRFIEVAGAAFYGLYHGDWAELLWRRYITTSQDVTVNVSLSIPYSTIGNCVRSEVVHICLDQWYLTLYAPYDRHGGRVAYNTGTVDATLTITAPDGNSAQSTFTVTVVRDLQSKEIVVHTPLSTQEGYATLDLSAYFTGPALEEIDFIAASSVPDVANVAVEGGRLVITSGSIGETQITVRGDYLGRIEEQTFTIAVTDDCPSWLCKGSFTGWRTTLLRPTTGGGNARALPETADGR